MARIQRRTERSPGAVRLPGIGERLDVTDVDGATVGIVRRYDGGVEIHASANPVVLDPVTASSAAAFAGGHFLLDPDVAARLGGVVGGIEFDWVRLDADDHAVGRTIAELAVRRRTGVTIVAVLRGSQPIVGPDPDLRFASGDDLIIAAQDRDRDRFVSYLAEGR